MPFSIFSTAWVSKLVDMVIVTTGFNSKTKTKYQIKTLPSDISVSTADIPSLRFTNLIVGKTYRVIGSCRVLSADSNGQIVIYNGVTVVASSQNQVGAAGPSDRFQTPILSAPFVATSTVITTDYIRNGTTAILEGNGAISFTWVGIEELPNHEVTTEWT